MNSTLNTAADPMGAAIYDYHKTGEADTLIVHSSMCEDDEIPVADLFRQIGQMSELEQMAMHLASGKILDVGAGAGCHSLALKQLGKEVVAVDISPLSVQIMQERGVNSTAVVLSPAVHLHCPVMTGLSLTSFSRCEQILLNEPRELICAQPYLSSQEP